MELWIRSQDKKRLIKSEKIIIVEFTDKTECEIWNDTVKLGTYKTKERALEVLDEIDEFIDLFNRNGFGNVLSDDGVHPKHTIYHMPKE